VRKFDVGVNRLDAIWTSESEANTLCGRRSRPSQHYKVRRSYVSARVLKYFLTLKKIVKNLSKKYFLTGEDNFREAVPGPLTKLE
jgi:hypothetical protein